MDKALTDLAVRHRELSHVAEERAVLRVEIGHYQYVFAQRFGYFVRACNALQSQLALYRFGRTSCVMPLRGTALVLDASNCREKIEKLTAKPNPKEEARLEENKAKLAATQKKFDETHAKLSPEMARLEKDVADHLNMAIKAVRDPRPVARSEALSRWQSTPFLVSVLARLLLVLSLLSYDSSLATTTSCARCGAGRGCATKVGGYCHRHLHGSAERDARAAAHAGCPCCFSRCIDCNCSTSRCTRLGPSCFCRCSRAGVRTWRCSCTSASPGNVRVSAHHFGAHRWRRCRARGTSSGASGRVVSVLQGHVHGMIGGVESRCAVPSRGTNPSRSGICLLSVASV